MKTNSKIWTANVFIVFDEWLKNNCLNIFYLFNKHKNLESYIIVSTDGINNINKL